MSSILDPKKMATMPREAAAAALPDLLRERERRRRRNPLEFFVPHAKQLPFVTSKAPIRVFCAANRSGKTTIGVVEDLWWALACHPYRTVPLSSRIWVVSAASGRAIT